MTAISTRDGSFFAAKVLASASAIDSMGHDPMTNHYKVTDWSELGPGSYRVVAEWLISNGCGKRTMTIGSIDRTASIDTSITPACSAAYSNGSPYPQNAQNYTRHNDGEFAHAFREKHESDVCRICATSGIHYPHAPKRKNVGNHRTLAGILVLIFRSTSDLAIWRKARISPKYYDVYRYWSPSIAASET